MAKLDLAKPFRVLSLDGGGSLGVYTLGVLIEIERMLDTSLHEEVDLVYGTSTGSIIGSMIALGEDVGTIKKRYFDIAPDVMGRWFPRGKSAALRGYATDIFGNRTFEDFLIDIGIVTTHLEYNRPMVFKRHVSQAHGSRGSFRPGFGCTIADAVMASCAAHPFFRKVAIATPDHGTRNVVDGGFTANNPALFALADVLGPLNIERPRTRILSVGTGQFPEKMRLLSAFRPMKTLMTLLGTSSNTVNVLHDLLFGDVYMLRISQTFADIRTDFLESNLATLEKIFQLGRKSFEKYESDIRDFFGPSESVVAGA